MTHDYPEAYREPEILSGRVPPSDLGAEAAVLSAALLDVEAADIVVDELDGQMFYSDNHRLIFEAIENMRQNRQPVDVVQVVTWLRNRELIQRAGGAKYLGELVDATPAIANIAAHCKTVREKAQQRRIISAAQKISGEGYGAIGEHSEWVAKSERAMFAETRGHEKRHPERIGPLVARERATALDPTIVDRKRIKTGIEDFDAEIGGLFVGDLFTFAARPGMGKSALVQTILRNICKQRWADDEDGEIGTLRYECLLFSLEMDKEQVAQRILSQESRVGIFKIKTGGREKPFGAAEKRHMEEAEARIADMHLHVDDTPAISILEVVSKSRRWCAEVRDRGRQPGAIVVDYLQQATYPHSGHRMSREQEVGKMSTSMKNAARELGVPYVAVSQLNRSIEGRPKNDRRPNMSDLRESGQIEQDSDTIVFVYREHYYDKSADRLEAELIIRKQRNGKTGIVPVGWQGWCTAFVNVPDAVQEPEA